MTRRAFDEKTDEKIARRYLAGETAMAISHTYEASHVAVINSLKRSGISRRKGPVSIWTGSREQKDSVLRMYADGMSVRRIAGSIGCRTECVSDTLAESGVPLKPGGRTHPKFDYAASLKVAREYSAGASLRDLAATYDVSVPTVKSALRRVGCPTRHGGKPPFWTDERIDWLIKEYQGGRSQQDIANEIGISQGAVSTRLRNAGIRNPVNRGGENHGCWKGGRILIGGYVLVRPQLEDLVYCQPNASGYVAEHRLVAGRFLGRRLLASETVHHINGDRTDNRLENLQVRQGRHGKGVAYECRDCGSKDVVATPLAD